MRATFFIITILSLLSCNNKPVEERNTVPEFNDTHSFAQPGKAVVTHLDLDINVDFTNRIIRGKAAWKISNAGQTDTVVFDTRQMRIEKVTLDEDETPAIFSLGAEVEFLGKALRVAIKKNTGKINIYYATEKEAAALQWLEPQQTGDKKFPFLFTQSQAILARTWIPCQDSPGIRFTYNAKVTVPAGLLALMSAENPQQKSSDGHYVFKQSQPVPSYLMALAAGDISFQPVDARTGIYAEPGMLPRAVREFADLGKLVQTAEKLYGPYRWGRYDLLVLPPAFPFGGMENPMLTFVTPTVIAGDRSLVSLVAHELAHSWSGNLVTNATWNDFWLNEGFTTYFERRIVEENYGVAEREMQEMLGLQDLKDEMGAMGETNPDTRLKLDLKGRDPDLGVSAIAYEKGYLFLRHLEDAVGRQAFDSFLIKYFDSHAFQSVTTEQFLDYLDKNLLDKHPSLKEKLQIKSWVYAPGLPENIPKVRSEKFISIDSLLPPAVQAGSFNGLSKRIRSTNEKLYFLRKLPDNLTVQHMQALDKEFGFSNSGNAEILCVWYTLAVRHQYKPAYAGLELFLTEVGRRKFLLPIYRELIKTPAGKEWARRIYQKARPNYHSVAYNSIDALLK
jgi:aminopeptidase N